MKLFSRMLSYNSLPFLNRRFQRIAVAIVPLFLSGCAAFNYTSSDAPVALRLEQIAPLQPAPRIALVLGSGGPRGYAHLSILKALEDAGIVPDIIIGSSVGALIGTFWADGLNAAQLTEQALSGGPLTLFDPNPFADRGWIRGERLQRYVESQLKNGQRLEQLPRRVVVVATERPSSPSATPKEARYFLQGNAAVAVRASAAVMGIVSPVGILGTEYEDADESLPVAVTVARRLGAQFVIAVDVSALPGSTPPEAAESMRKRDIARAARIAPEAAKADFVLHPDLGYYASPLRSYFLQSLALGETYAKAQLPALQSRLKQVAP
jgi:NTE family protein